MAATLQLFGCMNMCAIRSLLGIMVIVSIALMVGTVVEKARRPKPATAVIVAPVTVVDVARGVDPDELATLVRLRADERVTAVEDQPVANDLAAGAAIAQRHLGSGTFLDLTVVGSTGARRVLVLMH